MSLKKLRIEQMEVCLSEALGANNCFQATGDRSEFKLWLERWFPENRTK